MNHHRTTPEFSLYAKLIFGERASFNPARGASPLQTGGDGVARLPDAPPATPSAVDGGAPAPADAETA